MGARRRKVAGASESRRRARQCVPEAAEQGHDGAPRGRVHVGRPVCGWARLAALKQPQQPLDQVVAQQVLGVDGPALVLVGQRGKALQ